MVLFFGTGCNSQYFGTWLRFLEPDVKTWLLIGYVFLKFVLNPDFLSCLYILDQGFIPGFCNWLYLLKPVYTCYNFGNFIANPGFKAAMFFETSSWPRVFSNRLYSLEPVLKRGFYRLHKSPQNSRNWEPAAINWNGFKIRTLEPVSEYKKCVPVPVNRSSTQSRCWE